MCICYQKMEQVFVRPPYLFMLKSQSSKSQEFDLRYFSKQQRILQKIEVLEITSTNENNIYSQILHYQKSSSNRDLVFAWCW